MKRNPYLHTPKLRVLVIDDEKDFTDMVKLNLERAGNYEVLCQNAGINAEQTAIEWRPDVVLLDVLMPLVDGGDVYLSFKDRPELRHIPIIVVTALASPNEPPPTSGDESSWTLAKPVTTEVLIEVIEMVTSCTATHDPQPAGAS